MKKWLTRILPIFFFLSTSGCSEWDDFIDTITGSDDDNKKAATATTSTTSSQTATTTQTSSGTSTNQNSSGTSTSSSTEYNKSESYTYYGIRNGGRMAWRIPKKGPAFGSNLKVVFSDGHSVVVRNTSKNYRESDGFVFKPGLGPNGEGDANTGTAHGGVYIHAPYGNRSTRLTIHYKK